MEKCRVETIAFNLFNNDLSNKMLYEIFMSIIVYHTLIVLYL